MRLTQFANNSTPVSHDGSLGTSPNRCLFSTRSSARLSIGKLQRSHDGGRTEVQFGCQALLNISAALPMRPNADARAHVHGCSSHSK